MTQDESCVNTDTAIIVADRDPSSQDYRKSVRFVTGT